MKPAYFIGLMSGTSLDGIDCALVDFSESTPRLVGALCQPFDPALRDELLALQSATPDELHRAALAANGLSRASAQAVQALLAQTGVAANDITAIGHHGQTIRHRPELGYTLQIGNHALLAELTGITVVGDFRSRDVAAGGQGAPLVPAFHQAIFGATNQTRIVVNIGGIANLTVLAPDQSVLGWDSGPGNVLMDDWISRERGLAFDANGDWAASGKVDHTLLTDLLAEPFFALPAPKSTGRDLFNADWLLPRLQDHASADIQATLCRLTAQSIADAARPHHPAALFLCGGGAHNATLRRMLSELLPDAAISTTAELGVDPDWLEAMAFAWLARCCLQNQPANLPAVTGAAGSRILGAIWPQ